MGDQYTLETVVRGLRPHRETTDEENPGENNLPDMQANTGLIQDALDSKAIEGGGVVVVPPGRFFIRTLTIPSATELHLAANCCLVAWPYVRDYETNQPESTTSQDIPHTSQLGGISLIVSVDTDRASLSGRGRIDGNGFAFWDIPIREYERRGGSRSDLEVRDNWEDDSPFWRAKTQRVSPLVEFKNCRNVLVKDITITNSPGWTLHLLCCDWANIHGISITNHMYGPNTDGIDINGCRDVIVSSCFISCGDDAIIIKATETARSCERICLRDSVLETHCAAFGIGAEVAFPIRDIVVTNITVKRALRMVQIEVWDPGLVENVLISNISGANMTDIPLERPIYIDIQHHGRTDGLLGAVRNVQIHGLSAITRGRCLFTAADGSSIERLNLNGILLTYPEIEDPEVSVPSSRSSQMSNDSPYTRSRRSAFVFDNVKDSHVRDIYIQWPDADRGDRAGVLRERYDWGELTADKRKQKSLAGEVAMNAFLFRQSSQIMIDAPFVKGNGADVYELVGENGRIILNGEEISPER